MFEHAERWARIPGKRSANVYLKEFDKRGARFSLERFRSLLGVGPNWPTVTGGADASGHRGFPTSGSFRLCAHYPEALMQQTADSRGRILGLKS